MIEGVRKEMKMKGIVMLEDVSHGKVSSTADYTLTVFRDDGWMVREGLST